MKKALFIAWLALAHACMLQAQGVNVFDESSIGMGDSIDQEKYQVIYDLSYVFGNHHNKQGTNTNRITEQMLLQIGNLYSAFYSYPHLPKRLAHLQQHEERYRKQLLG